MSNGEETNEEEVLLEDYLTEDSEDVVEEVPSVNTINPRTAVVDSAFILEEIQTWMIAPMYFFEIGYLSHSTSGSPYDDYVASSEDFYSIQDIMTNSLFSGFLSEDIVTRYNNLITNPTENAQQELAELIGDVGDYLVKGTKQRIQDIDRGGATDGSDAFGKGGVMYPHSIQINFNKKKTRKGNPAFSAEGTPVPYDMVSENVANRNWSEEAKLDEEQSSLEEAEQKAAEASETYVDAEGIVRTSSPAWGYTTDKDGRYTVVTDGESKKKAAPFYKGSEFYLFTDIGPSEIFRLQQQMVRAGMAAPRVDEYGVWSKREANFMAAVFTKATDSGQAEIDIRNNLQGWETTLTNMAEEYSATESFINLLNKTGYGKQTTQNVAPSTIKTMLDLAAASNGVELSARDYTNFAYVVLDALGKQAELEQAFEDSLPSDRDIILGAKFMDVRGIQKGDSYRFFAGNDMPLVLPSMEWLTQSKGGPAPTIINAQDIINEEVGKLKANQVAGNKTLRDIQNVTNLFEQSMLNIDYGSESA